MKESVPGFPSTYPFSIGKILKNQHGTKVNQEYERVGPWISLYISLLHGENPNKARRIQRQCGKVL